MIRIDITALVFLYILFSVIAIFIVWAVMGYRKFRSVTPQNRDHIEHAWKCSICFHTYIDSLHEDISVCPLCGSYNKRT
jgi:hypothetical protein